MASASGHHEDGSCCSHHRTLPSVHQSLEEMNFERGIWGAALDGDLERVKTQVRKRGKPSEPDPLGYTALHFASRNGHYEVCRFLLESGADCRAQTHGGATPLHRASYCGHAEIAKLLLDHGADPAAADDDGKTSLHKAAENGHDKLCSLLLEHGPGLRHVRDKKLRRACDVVPSENKELRQLLDL